MEFLLRIPIWLIWVVVSMAAISTLAVACALFTFVWLVWGTVRLTWKSVKRMLTA